MELGLQRYLNFKYFFIISDSENNNFLKYFVENKFCVTEKGRGSSIQYLLYLLLLNESLPA
jgi:hypothetical protein